MHYFLRNNGIWLHSPELDKTKWIGVAWIHGADPKLTNRPALAKKVNAALRTMILTEGQTEQLNKFTDDATIPEISLGNRDLTSAGPNRLKAWAIEIRTPKMLTGIMRSLLIQLNDTTYLPDNFYIVPNIIEKVLNGKDKTQWKNCIQSHNLIRATLKTNIIVGFHPKAMNWLMTDDSGTPKTVHQHFKDTTLFYGIEETQYSESTGRWIFISKQNKPPSGAYVPIEILCRRWTILLELSQRDWILRV